MRHIAVALAVLAVLIGAGYFLVNSDGAQPSAKTTNSETSTETTDSQVDSQNANQPPAESGAYIEYSASALAQTTNTKLLFFHASWCPQCRALEADIEEQGVPNGTTIFKVDYDNSQDLRQKYGVTQQTTVVRIDDQGNLVGKYLAYSTPTLDAVVDNLL